MAEVTDDLRRLLREEMVRAGIYNRAAELEARRYYRPEEVAVMLQVSVRQVDKWAALGKLSFVKVDGHRRISGAALDRDIDALISER